MAHVKSSGRIAHGVMLKLASGQELYRAVATLSVVGSWMSLLLLLSLVGTSTAVAAVHQSTDRFFRVDDWTGYDLSTELSDGTSLRGFVAEANALDMRNPRTDAIIRFTFLPRFQCSPMISLIHNIIDTSEEALLKLMQSHSVLEVTIDGEPVDFPVMLERQGNQLYSFLNVNLDRRTSFRILIEIGNLLSVKVGDGRVLRFSLNGSKLVIAQAVGRCRNRS